MGKPEDGSSAAAAAAAADAGCSESTWLFPVCPEPCPQLRNERSPKNAHTESVTIILIILYFSRHCDVFTSDTDLLQLAAGLEGID